jgi:hypothetical protein
LTQSGSEVERSVNLKEGIVDYCLDARVYIIYHAIYLDSFHLTRTNDVQKRELGRYQCP